MPVIIYGATGYTGRLATDLAVAAGLAPDIAGRNPCGLLEMSTSLGLDYRLFSLESSAEAIDAGLARGTVLLNCAGPYHQTAGILIDACIRNGIHYLDISAELDSYQISASRNDAAIRAGVMLLPGCGGSVAMLGCLAGLTVASVIDPVSIDIGMRVAGPMSRGSLASAAGNTGATLERHDGELREWEGDATTTLDFGDGNGPVVCFGITLPDLITLQMSTNVPNIRTFVHLDSNVAFPTDLESAPDGLTAQERIENPYHASVEVTDREGEIHRSVLHTVNGYSFTAMASVEAVKRVLDGVSKPGFQVPAVLFGDQFVTEIAGSKWEAI
jgi:short subunit dehydrogenase-like uncharacterized protein